VTNDTYALLDLAYPGSFPKEARFRPDEKPPSVSPTLLTTEQASEYLSISAEPEAARKKEGDFVRSGIAK
jgi:hypothetical protein